MMKTMKRKENVIVRIAIPIGEPAAHAANRFLRKQFHKRGFVFTMYTEKAAGAENAMIFCIHTGKRNLENRST